ncbi:MAG TPA: choice-of-anchor Q domain-containing protein, partial [Rhodanobacteraceae bacterium]|nr:choice-of-anchor Q domain-containing protein [Rhodanobacteraceae bacterium]
KGPGRDRLAIDGHNADRVFLHASTGTLAIEDLTITGGRYEGQHAYGGCIYSKGSVMLTRSAVDLCAAVGADKAIGGGIVATENLTMYSSELAGNMVSVTTGMPATLVAAGGGALVAGELEMHESSISGNTVLAAVGKAYAGGALATSFTAKYSTFTGNQAVSSTGGIDNYSIAGGMAALYSIFLLDTTIDSNSADLAGGAFVSNSGFGTIVQSTISSNVGRMGIGGLAADVDLNMLGSTVAFNSGGVYGGGGVFSAGANANLESTILADNSPTDFDGAPVVTGSHNLVKVIGVQASPMPGDTITLDPGLGPLVNNGGGTRSHALGAGSVAIDAGSGGSLNLESDQRGAGFKRPVGAAQDIGAFEFDADRIMTNGYE